MKIVEKGKNMQVHANFLKLIAFGHIKDLCNHADCHYSLDCFSMTKSNFFSFELGFDLFDAHKWVAKYISYFSECH